MFEQFPYTNFHDLNLDWIVKIAKDFLDQYTHIQDTITNGLESLDNKAQELEALLQAWYDTHSDDIANQLADALQDIQAELTNSLNNLQAYVIQAEQDFINTLPPDYTALTNKFDEISEDAYAARVTNGLNVEHAGLTFVKTSNTVLKIYGTANANRRQLFLNGQSDLLAAASPFQKTLDAGKYTINVRASGYHASDWYLNYSYGTFAAGDILVSHTNPTTTITFTQPVMIGLSFATDTNWGTESNPTLMTVEITKLSAVDVVARLELDNLGMLQSTNDSTDRTYEINTILANNGKARLGKGVFYVTRITMPAGSTLEGIGEQTVIVKIPEDDYVPTIVANSKTTIKDMTIKGTLTEQPTAETVIDKNRVGIAIDGVVEPVMIQNCRIIGFTYSGINVLNTGSGTKSVMVSNCELKFNRTGINISASEYGCYINTICRDNFIGCNNAGGNNKFTNCGFDSNGFGFVVADTQNDGHGICVACSFNHNTDRAISTQGTDYGFIFSGCQIHYGLIRIDANSKGIDFIGCEFGGGVNLAQLSATNPLFINACVFFEDIRTQTDYTALRTIYNNSYLFNGTQIN